MRVLLIAALLMCEVWALGTIGNIKGDVVVQRELAGAWVLAKNGEQLVVGDVVKTDRDSSARLKFDDGTVATLGATTTFVIENYVNSNDKNSKARFRVDGGIFKVVTGAIGKVAPDNFTIATRTATMGIRGTTLYGLVGKGSSDRYACTSGAISVKSTSGASIAVNAGEMTTVAASGAPTKPVAVDMSLFEQVNDDNYLIYWIVGGATLLIVVAAIAWLSFGKTKKRRKK
ncbi:hypothetical protein AGMMS50229_01310 [Campylobacterota bacterium]|nr:hypothetical protein AGMMS50229_01310 [Campylobacterota bacterium]